MNVAHQIAALRDRSLSVRLAILLGVMALFWVGMAVPAVVLEGVRGLVALSLAALACASSAALAMLLSEAFRADKVAQSCESDATAGSSCHAGSTIGQANRGARNHKRSGANGQGRLCVDTASQTGAASVPLAVAGLLLPMAVRFGAPLMAALAVRLRGPGLAEAGFAYYLIGFYLLALAVETPLTLPCGGTCSKKLSRPADGSFEER